MKTYLDCIPCFMRQSLEGARHLTDDVGVHEQIMRDVLRMTAALDLNQPPPLMGGAIHRRLRELTGVSDPYREAKQRFNRLALAALPELAAMVERAPDPLLAAAELSIAANAIDMGLGAPLTEAGVQAALCGATDAPFKADGVAFSRAVADARAILYLADNAGEIAVDRLLIQALGPARVTLAVRGAPVLNDATLTDARQVGMPDLVQVIDNGSDAPGTDLPNCSAAFLRRFNEADLIIAKGQGNYETLSGVEKNIFFLFKVKCPVISQHAGLPLGTHALLQR